MPLAGLTGAAVIVPPVTAPCGGLGPEHPALGGLHLVVSEILSYPLAA